MRKFVSRIPIPTFLRMMRFWPPYWGAGIVVEHVADDLSEIRTSMTLRTTSTNYVGTHFGGNLYSMCDPWFMFMFLHRLGPEYIVWDKSATIHFRRPGKGKVTAVFRLSHEDIESVRKELESTRKVTPTFVAEIRDENGECVAEVEKVIYIRKKESKRA